MTMLAGGDGGRALLADVGLRRSLTAALRRRVPAPEAEDLAQTVLCDALASPRLPTDPGELRRWVAAIARHKVADWHRRARRLVPTEDGALDPIDPAPTTSGTVEARELLEDVLRAAERETKDGRTLGWLVREHEGDRLCDIAEDEGLPAPVVRQRVSRLRRALRARYAALLAVVLASGAGLAAWRSGARHTPAIVADATTDGQRVLAVLQGTWRVEELVLDPASEARLQSSERAFMARPEAFEVVVDGAGLRFLPGGRAALRGLSVSRVADGEASLVARAADGRAAVAAVSWTPRGEVLVTFDDGRLRGHARLVRGH